MAGSLKARASATVSSDESLDLDAQFCFALYSASRRVVRAYSLALKNLGLTYPQFLVLLVLWEWDRKGCDKPSVKELGKRLDLESGTTTPILKRLEMQGLAKRERQADDERQVFVRLTPAGRAIRKKVAKIPPALLEQCSVSEKKLFLLRDQLNQL